MHLNSHLLQPNPVDAAGRTINVLALDGVALAWAKRAWAALLGRSARCLVLARAAACRSVRASPSRVQAVMLAIGFFSPLTRVYHLAGALLAGALFCRGPRWRGDVLWWVVALALALAMPLRQKALLGETLWRAFDVGGLLHFALVGMSLWLTLACRPTQPVPRPTNSPRCCRSLRRWSSAARA